VDPADSLEVWRGDLILIAYRIQIADNPAHKIQTDDTFIVTALSWPLIQLTVGYKSNRPLQHLYFHSTLNPPVLLEPP
jgi:hypothetical protein